MNIWDKWFPAKIHLAEWIVRLKDYYVRNRAYHEMTAGDKANHPQVQLLMALIEPGGKYAEIGCGGGDVVCVVNRTAHAVGVDLSMVALAGARRRCGRVASFCCADVESLPFRSGIFDGVYSFEVLEHVPDPVMAVGEMIRLVRPGGFILLSFPNRFSLDLHLPKKGRARCLDYLMAAGRWTRDRWSRRIYTHVKPDLTGTPYPDGDLISAINPHRLAEEMARRGCRIDFCDSTYMCAHRPGADVNLAFQRGTRHPFVRHFGDHYLILAHRLAAEGRA